LLTVGDKTCVSTANPSSSRGAARRRGNLVAVEAGASGLLRCARNDTLPPTYFCLGNKQREGGMAWQRMVLQIGMGTDIRGGDYTKAAVRALRDALWHNSLSVADAVGLPVDSMQVEVTIGVPQPEQVDKAAVLAVLPHGTGTVEVVEGGLEI